MIREASMRDLEAVSIIVADDYELTGPVDVAPMDYTALVDNVASFIAHPGARVLVVEADGKVNGAAAFTLGGWLWRPETVNAVEAFWAVRRDIAGTMTGNKLMIRLADAMIEAAKGAGAVMFTLGGSLKYPAVARMLSRRHGLTPRETLSAGRIA